MKHPSHEEVVQRLLTILQQLQALPPLEAVGGQNWWQRYRALKDLYTSAQEEALRVVPEDIDALLQAITERRDALFPLNMQVRVKQRESDQ